MIITVHLRGFSIPIALSEEKGALAINLLRAPMSREVAIRESEEVEHIFYADRIDGFSITAQSGGKPTAPAKPAAGKK